MGMPHITSFCWCMGLELGAKVVGVLHLLVSAILLLICIVGAEDARAFVGTSEDASLYSTWYKLLVGAAVVTVVHCILAVTLLVSIWKRNTTGLRVWVILMSVLCAAALVSIVVSVAMRGFSGTGSDIFLAFLEGLLFFGFIVYCIICVFSYYLMLRSAEDMEGPNKSMY